MPLSTNINSREFEKFTETTVGDTAVRIQGEIDSSPLGLSVGGRVTEVTLTSSGWTALPATALEFRNAISIQNLSGQTIKLNYDNSVSGFVGVSILNNSERYYDMKDTITLYGKSASGSAVIVVEELA